MGSLINHFLGREGRTWRRFGLLAIMVLGLILAAVVIWFNVFFYPGYGLGGLAQEQYQAALLRVGEGFAASESLTLASLCRSNFRVLSPESAYAWGTLSLLTPEGEPVYLWVALHWSRHRWWRENCYRLADPRDRLFFAESLLSLGNSKKIAYALENLTREELRRLREVEWSKKLF